MGQMVARIAEANNHLGIKLSRVPTHKEVAKYLKVPVSTVRLVTERSKRPISINQPVNDRGCLTLQVTFLLKSSLVFYWRNTYVFVFLHICCYNDIELKFQSFMKDESLVCNWLLIFRNFDLGSLPFVHKTSNWIHFPHPHLWRNNVKFLFLINISKGEDELPKGLCNVSPFWLVTYRC